MNEVTANVQNMHGTVSDEERQEAGSVNEAVTL